MLNISESRP